MMPEVWSISEKRIFDRMIWSRSYNANFKVIHLKHFNVNTIYNLRKVPNTNLTFSINLFLQFKEMFLAQQKGKLKWGWIFYKSKCCQTCSLYPNETNYINDSFIKRLMKRIQLPKQDHQNMPSSPISIRYKQNNFQSKPSWVIAGPWAPDTLFSFRNHGKHCDELVAWFSDEDYIMPQPPINILCSSDVISGGHFGILAENSDTNLTFTGGIQFKYAVQRNLGHSYCDTIAQ